MKKTRVFWGIAVFVFALSGCLHGRQGASVIGFRDGSVFIKKNLSFKIGELPPPWQEFKTGAKAIAFHNDLLGATISVDAFCGGSFEDLPLKTLTGQQFAGISNHSVIKEENFELDGRGALRTVSNGAVDGVALKFDSVVVKKNNCTIDFVYMAPPENYGGGAGDFETVFNGFSFHSD